MAPAPFEPTVPPGRVLARLPERGREAVLAVAVPRTWARGTLLTRDGEDAHSLLVLTSGHVLVRISTEAGDRVALGVQGPGDVLGEVGLLNPRRERTADAEALDTVTGLTLRREDFDRVRRENPVVDDFVMELMARRIDRLSHRLAEAFHVPVGTRVARRLYEVGRLYADAHVVRVPLTQEDVAGLAGTTRPTANAALRALEQDGLVRLGRGQVELLDLTGLRARCR
ncbi:MAG TPA: Crp/Fnr family transcriptional regulator [Friedmanniella sp.]